MNQMGGKMNDDTETCHELVRRNVQGHQTHCVRNVSVVLSREGWGFRAFCAGHWKAKQHLHGAESGWKVVSKSVKA